MSNKKDELKHSDEEELAEVASEQPAEEQPSEEKKEPSDLISDPLWHMLKATGFLPEDLI